MRSRVTARQAASRLVIVAAIIASVAWLTRPIRPLHHSPGVLVPGDPEQYPVSATTPSFGKEGWDMKPLARYFITARVLRKERYTTDLLAKLIPWDLALGWGRMSDTMVLDRIDISQSARFYHWRYWGRPPIPEKEIVTHSANCHIISADRSVEHTIDSLRVGSVVKLDGFLVECTHPQVSRSLPSSLTRDDEGEGACEIIYVKSAWEITPAHR